METKVQKEARSGYCSRDAGTSRLGRMGNERGGLTYLSVCSSVHTQQFPARQHPSCGLDTLLGLEGGLLPWVRALEGGCYGGCG